MNINDFVVRFANVNGTGSVSAWDMQKFLYNTTKVHAACSV